MRLRLGLLIAGTVVNFALAATDVVLIAHPGLVRDLRAMIARDDGCGADQPDTVPYHPGMTLCPGQSTVITVPIIITPERQPTWKDL